MGEENIYIYIYTCIYWVLFGGFEAINASNQRTICSRMIFQPSCFILYFIFSMNLVFFMKFSIMTSPRYYDVTQFWTDPGENCTAYIKLEIKDISFVRIFLFSEYLLRKLRFITKTTSIVQLPYTSPPVPFGPPIRMVSVRDTSFTYLRILFQLKKQKIVFIKNGENQVRSPLAPLLYFYYSILENNSELATRRRPYLEFHPTRPQPPFLCQVDSY